MAKGIKVDKLSNAWHIKIMTLPKELTTITTVSKFLTIFLLLSLPFVGFLLGLKYQQQFIEYLESRASVDQYMLKTQPAATQSASTASPAPNGDKANWKTYENNKLGYSFRYPPTLSVSNCSNNQCGEIIFYPKSPNKLEINGDNKLADISLIGGKYCQSENKFKDYTNFKRASLQAQCDLPGVHNVNEPILPVIDEQTTNVSGELSRYSFYLQGYQGYRIGPFYAFFFPKPITETNTNKDIVTYYGVYWIPNRDKPLTPDKMSVFDQILSTFRFIE